MKSGYANINTSIEYYDSDYPSPFFHKYEENLNNDFKYMTICRDIHMFKELAQDTLSTGDPILELCCGTGRISLPLLDEGFNVTSVDILSGMLDQFKSNQKNFYPHLESNLDLHCVDVTELNLNKKFPLIIMGFNSFNILSSYETQMKALKKIFTHLTPGGNLILDLVNPLIQDFNGDSIPKVTFTKRNIHTGNMYTRFSMSTAIDLDQVQNLHGWYDEIHPDGTVKRAPFSMSWRLLFRQELIMMLESVGFKIKSFSSGYTGRDLSPYSINMMVTCTK